MKVSVLREQHEAPEYAQRLVMLAGGLNMFGHPNYRWVWGWGRLTWIGGLWTDRTASDGVLRQVFEMREVPKYLPENRWHLEKWLPAALYGSPRMWNLASQEIHHGRSLPALGPYPQFGEYEHALTLDEPCFLCIKKNIAAKCEHRQFVQLTSEIAYRMARAIEFSRGLAEEDRRAAVERCHERDAMQDDKAIDEILGADPVEIPRRRQQYLDKVIAPKLDWAIAKAHKKKAQQMNPTASTYQASVAPLTIFKK